MSDTFRAPTQRSDKLYDGPKEQYLGDRYDHHRHVSQQHRQADCNASAEPGACVAVPEPRRKQMHDRDEGARVKVDERESRYRGGRMTTHDFMYSRSVRKSGRASSSTHIATSAFESMYADGETTEGVAANIDDSEWQGARAMARQPLVGDRDVQAAPRQHPSSDVRFQKTRQYAMQQRDPRPLDRYSQMSEVTAARVEAESQMKTVNYGSSLYAKDPDVATKGLFVGRKSSPWS